MKINGLESLQQKKNLKFLVLKIRTIKSKLKVFKLN